MKSTKSSVVISLFALFLSSNTYAASFLSADEVTKLFSGKTANGEHLRKGHKYKVFFNKNGTYIQARTDGSKLLGKWRIKNNGAHCIKPNHRKREFCRRVKSSSQGTYIKIKERAFKGDLEVVKLTNFVEGDKTK